MGRGRRTLNRMDYRGDYDDGHDNDELEDEEEASSESEEESEDESEGEEEGASTKKKKKKKSSSTTRRTRTPKVVRMKAVWRVYDGNSKMIGEFPYNRKQDAEALVAERMEKAGEKKGTFYILREKVSMEEK